MKIRGLIMLLVTCCLILLVLFQSKFYYLCQSKPLTNKTLLVDLAIEALKSKEVPVSSIIMYNGRVIGKGYNTVMRDTNIGGHAEINAISDVIKSMGTSTFNALNRDSLILITTYEPCLMCRGAIIENRIKHVEFMKEKTLTHWIKNHLKALHYEMNKRKINNNTLQDSLFCLHPDYKPADN